MRRPLRGLYVALFLAGSALTSCFPLSASASLSQPELVKMVYQLRAEIDDLKFVLNQIKVTQQILESRDNSQEEGINKLKQQVAEVSQADRELLKGRLTLLDKNLATQQTTQQEAVTDIKQLRQHANEASTALGQCRTRLDSLETKLNTQLAQLSTAMQSLTKAVQRSNSSTPATTETAAVASGNKYTVQAGDSLGSIAKRHNCSVESLRTANKLSSSTIYKGQELIIPTPSSP